MSRRKVIKQFDDSAPKFRSAAGDLKRSLEVNKLTFEINGHSFTHNFHVVNTLDEGIILGIDFLKAYKFVIDTEDNAISFRCRGGDADLCLRSTEPVRIASIGLDFDIDVFDLSHVTEK